MIVPYTPDEANSSRLGSGDPAVNPAEVRRKVAWRVLPLIFLLYIVAYLDRANAGFAKLAMAGDLKFSESVFGFGFGIFFVGYLFLEIPGALIVERWSARKWFSRILISWGFVSALTGFVRTPGQFYAARFLLGVAEAGFFPGIIVYFTHWFTSRDRARALSGLIMAVPFSLSLGARVSGILLNVRWFGVAGWKWLFLLEGLPAVVLGIITLFALDDHPHEARWLSLAERNWLTTQLSSEAAAKLARGKIAIRDVLRLRNVWLLGLGIFAVNTGGYAFTFWLPTALKGISGLSSSGVLSVSGLVYGCGILGVFVSGQSSDRSGERKWHAVGAMAFTALFLAASSIAGQPLWLVVMWLCLTGVSGYFWPSPFWALPTATLGASGAAVSIGLINMFANIAGFLGNFNVGYLKSHGFGDRACLLMLACCFVIGAAIVAMVRVPPINAPEKLQ